MSKKFLHKSYIELSLYNKSGLLSTYSLLNVIKLDNLIKHISVYK